MKQLRCNVIAIVTLLCCTAAIAAAAQKVHVVVKVPADTPADAEVYLAGSLPAVGEWKAAGVKLERQKDGTYAVDVELEPDQTLEFKFTRGTWETVEKKADGSERDNRSVKIQADTKRIDATVEKWASNGSSASPIEP